MIKYLGSSWSGLAVSGGRGLIAGLFLVTETDEVRFGDIVLVFDRAYPGANNAPALVPLERQNLTGAPTTWAPADLPWRVLPLPEETHAVRVHVEDLPDPDLLSIDGTDEDRVNLEVFLPTLGRVGVGRLELEMTSGAAFDPDATGFAPLEFEVGERPSATPEADDRVLILDVPGLADTVFYVLTNGTYAWRMTLPQARNDAGPLANAVLRARFNDDFSDRPSAAVTIPGADDQVWLAFSQPSDEVHRLTFALGN
jgi:hypothetical protein